MHRVITKRLDHRNNWIVEAGPWHISRNDAENWAAILRHLGYNAQVESLHGMPGVQHDEGDPNHLLSGLT